MHNAVIETGSSYQNGVYMIQIGHAFWLDSAYLVWSSHDLGYDQQPELFPYNEGDSFEFTCYFHGSIDSEKTIFSLMRYT